MGYVESGNLAKWQTEPLVPNRKRPCTTGLLALTGAGAAATRPPAFRTESTRNSQSRNGKPAGTRADGLGRQDALYRGKEPMRTKRYLKLAGLLLAGVTLAGCQNSASQWTAPKN